MRQQLIVGRGRIAGGGCGFGCRNGRCCRLGRHKHCAACGWRRRNRAALQVIDREVGVVERGRTCAETEIARQVDIARALHCREIEGGDKGAIDAERSAGAVEDHVERNGGAGGGVERRPCAAGSATLDAVVELPGAIREDQQEVLAGIRNPEFHGNRPKRSGIDCRSDELGMCHAIGDRNTGGRGLRIGGIDRAAQRTSHWRHRRELTDGRVELGCRVGLCRGRQCRGNQHHEHAHHCEQAETPSVRSSGHSISSRRIERPRSNTQGRFKG